jgi:hypothetical protein
MEKARKSISQTPSALRAPETNAVRSPSSEPDPGLSDLANSCFDVRAAEQAGDLPPDLSCSTWEVPFLGRLRGILAQCAIPGCDVHYVTREMQILEHVPEGAITPLEFAAARQFLRQAGPEVIAVLVFERSLEVLTLDGGMNTLAGES